MAFLTRPTYDPDKEPNAFALVHALRDAWEHEDWDLLASLCHSDVRLEGPSVGTHTGKDAVVELFKSGRRFPGMTGSDHRRSAAGADVGIQVYDIYLEHTRRLTVTEIVEMRDGRAAYWLTLQEPWPDR